MTHSPRIAAIATNKPFGEDANTSHAIRHRIAWLQRDKQPATPHPTTTTTEQPLRERTA